LVHGGQQAGIHGQKAQTDQNQDDGKARTPVTVVAGAALRTAVGATFLASFFSGKVF
jgi:hypothetical protein